MIGYVTLGTNDFPRATRFYDALLAEIGGKRTMEFDGFVVWSTGPKAPGLAVTKPYDGKNATVGNGVMVALAAGSKEKVDAVYRKAMELGARDEGAPGPRSETFYAAYFRDPDGNKLNAFHFGR
jgi:catechol 2,3-dioxygenase-like lactoylglutathione lyase family enzyme